MRFVCPDGEAPLADTIDARPLLEAGHVIDWHLGAPVDATAYAARCAGADGILAMWSVPPGAITAIPTLRVVSFTGTGVARFVDLAEARSCGVAVCNVPSYGANAVAEHALALLLAVARRVPSSDADVRAGRWQPQDGFELGGRRLGVVGAGPIGVRMVELGQAVGMDVVAWTRTADPARAAALGVPLVTLADLFASSDVVSVHVAHTPETEGLVSAELIAAMPRHAVLINTARAEVVDRAALAAALAAGRLAGAGLDVFDPEPPAADDPLVRSDRVVLTPHTAYRTPEAGRDLMRIAVDNLVAFAAGTPVNVVA